MNPTSQQCTLAIYASSRRAHGRMVARELGDDMGRSTETRALEFRVEPMDDGKCVAVMDVPTFIGGHALEAVLKKVRAAMKELLRVYPDLSISQIDELPAEAARRGMRKASSLTRTVIAQARRQLVRGVA